MFSENTVFVLGAGSNLDHGFLLGSTLRSELKKILTVRESSEFRVEGDKFIRSLLGGSSYRQLWGMSAADISRAARIIRDGIDTKPSIDEFMDIHASDAAVVKLAKLAIAWTILTKEAASDLFVPLQQVRADEVKPVKASWLFSVWHLLTKGVRTGEVERLFDKASNNVTFVTFNYDRSLEQFIYRMLLQTYQLHPTTAGKIVETADIRHVYGTVGAWSPPFATPKLMGRPFGSRNGLDLLYDGSEQEWARMLASISTYTEEIRPETTRAIQATIGDAKQLYFMGMGYHSQNMEILLPKKNLDAHTIAGTGVGLSPTFCEAVSQRVLGRTKKPESLNGGVVRVDRDCSAMFHEFAHRMDAYHLDRS